MKRPLWEALVENHLAETCPDCKGKGYFCGPERASVQALLIACLPQEEARDRLVRKLANQGIRCTRCKGRGTSFTEHAEVLMRWISFCFGIPEKISEPVVVDANDLVDF